MIENVDNLLDSMTDEGPSSDFVSQLEANLRRRQLEGKNSNTPTASPTAHGHDSEDQIVRTIDITETHEHSANSGLRSRAAWFAGVAAAVAMLFIGLSLIRTSESTLNTADTSPAPTDPGDTVSVDSNIVLLSQSTFLEPGTYRVDSLGTEITFSVDALTSLLNSSPGLMVFSDLDTDGRNDRTLTIRRLPFLPSPQDLTAEPPGMQWPGNDVRGWVDALRMEMLIAEPVVTMVGGQPAIRFSLDLSDFRCTDGDCEQSDATDLNINSSLFTSEAEFVVWIVDQGQEDPLVITSAIDDADERAWFEMSEALIAGFTLSAPAANPVQNLSAGPAQLEAWGDVEAVLPDGGTLIFESVGGSSQLSPRSVDARIELLTNPLDRDGVRVETTDQFLDLLNRAAAQVVEGETITVDGVAARSFAIDGGAFPTPVLILTESEASVAGAGWRPPETGFAWVIEHPERGFLLASARQVAPSFEGDAVREWTIELVRSVDFTGGEE